MPSLKEMGRLRAAAAAAAAEQAMSGSNLPPSSPSALRSSSPPPLGRSNDEGSDLPLPPTLPRISRVPDMSAFGQRNLKRFKLAAGSERDYMEICKTTDAQERQNLETFSVFRLIDKVDVLTQEIREAKATEFKGNTEINAEVRNYTRGVLLDPNTRFYAGNIAQLIMDGMRKESVPKIPSKDAGAKAIKAFEQIISRQLSVDKNHIKSEIEATFDDAAEERDIASLVSRVLSSWGVAIPLTLELLWRFALLRTLLASDKGRDFWLAVDKQLHDLRSDTDAGVYVYALEDNFEKDLEKYGKLNSDVELDADVGPHSPKWLQRVRKLAPKIENPKATNAGSAKAKSVAGKKRKRPQADADDEDAETENMEKDSEDAESGNGNEDD